jgi:hypothetical protein
MTMESTINHHGMALQMDSAEGVNGKLGTYQPTRGCCVLI